MTENEEIWEVFRAESSELLQTFEGILLEMETAGPDADSINALFRAAHTLKGTAGMAEFQGVVDFAHVVESLLEEARGGRLDITPEIISTLLLCRDHLGDLFDRAFGHSEPGAEMRAAGEALRRRLLDALDAGVAAELQSAASAGADAAAGAKQGATARWHISIRFGPDVFRHGLDPIPLLAYLKELGTIEKLVTVTGGLPPVEAMDPESCYLGCEIQFSSDRDRAQIEQAFEFVRQDCRLTVLGPDAGLAELAELMRALPEGEDRAADFLLAAGAITAPELELLRKGIAITEGRPARGLAAAAGDAAAGEANATETPGRDEEFASSARTASFLRIESRKLDALINQVGELAITAVGLNQAAARSGDTDLLEQTAIMNRMIGEARDSALKLRMVQVGDTFRRFRRYVREVGRELGKDIRLSISGGDTELDKTVVEKIEDPLTHIIRNAIDHGIETAALREAAGKPPQGTLHLRAYHETGSFVIEIADDGAGIDAARVQARAIEKGLIKAQGHSPAEDEIFALLFQPGFSTAAEVTNLSGRGVGLDVVKKEIEALRGMVNVRSQPGAGTTFTIRLPLTLAIIDGFLVGVGDSACIVPLEQMVECLTIGSGDRIDSRRNCINLRGEVLPFIDLGEMFHLEAERQRKQNIVVVQYGDLRCGLLVDDLLGEYQTIIKPLGKIFDGLKGISGMSVLGDGEIAFILDIPALAGQVAQNEASLYGSPV